MKNLLAIALAAFLPTGLGAEDAGPMEMSLGSTTVLVIEESAPIAKDVVCARGAGQSADCMAMHRAVLTARLQKVSARERSRWM